MKAVEAGNGLVVLDADRRTYAGLSRDGTYWHLIQPASEATVKALEYEDANGLRVQPVALGQLICTCAGGRFHRHCYRTEQAEAFERSRASEVDWGLAETAAVAS